MSHPSAFSRPPTAQEAVLGELRRAIASGELRPGQPIRQDTLAERLGVSRVPVREALKILQGEGQVTYQPHRGYSVAELDVDALREVYRIRSVLESEAVREASVRLQQSDIDLLIRAAWEVDQAAVAGDTLAMNEANRRFHFGLMDPCGMPRLLDLVRILWDSTEVYRTYYYSAPASCAVVSREHAAIVSAAEAGQTDLLVALLDQHRANAVASIETWLRPGVETTGT